MPDVASLLDINASFGSVIAAVRFDETGRHCLRQALLHAAHTGRPALALHVLHETPRTCGFYRNHDHGELLRPNTEVARELLADFAAEALADEPDGRGATLWRLVVSGVPARRIVEVAQLSSAELIVIGPRKEARLERWLGADVTGAVLRHAPCPVLVVDPDGNHVDPGIQRPDRPLPPAMEMP